MFVIEILHRAVDIFEDYFNECTETSLKENFVIVYEVNYSNKISNFFLFYQNMFCFLKLLDEMLDNGFPLATEVNILKELIKPPNMFRKVANLVTGDSK